MAPPRAYEGRRLGQAMVSNSPTKKALRKLLGYYGFQITRMAQAKNVATVNMEFLSRYRNDTHDPYLLLYREALKKTNSVDSFEKQSRFFVIYQMIQRIFRNQMQGSVAECGCFRGHSTYIIASLLKANNFMNRFYIFDSFEGGLSDKSPEDRTELGNTTPEESARQKLWFSSSYEEVTQLLSPFPFARVYNGWIPGVFEQAELKHEVFSLVHIDVDLYEPIKQSLNFFFGRMVPGGMIIVDDYGHSQFPGAKRAVDEFLVGKRFALTLENSLSGYLIVV